jgi:hypothetical protein
VEKCIQSQLIQTEYTARIGEYKILFGHNSVTIRLDCIQFGLETAPSPSEPVLHPETVIPPVPTRLDRKYPQPSRGLPCVSGWFPRTNTVHGVMDGFCATNAESSMLGTKAAQRGVYSVHRGKCRP